MEFTLSLSMLSSSEHGARQCACMCTVVVVSMRGRWWGDDSPHSLLVSSSGGLVQ